MHSLDEDYTQRPDSLAGRVWRGGLPWIDVAIGIVALILAMVQLLVIDRHMMGFVLVWLTAPIMAVCFRISRRRSSVARGWAMTYLILTSLGTFIADSGDKIHGFQCVHHGETEFATKWNKLDLTSRRMIAWQMALGGASVFWALGYFHGWRHLHAPLKGQHAGFSMITVFLVLFTCWFLPAVALIPLTIEAFLS